MANKTFLPYENNSRLGLSIEELKIDGVDKTNLIDKEKRKINLFEFHDAKRLELIFSCIIPPEFADELIPESERQDPPWRVIGRMTCDATKFRKGIQFERSQNPFQWQASTKVDLQDIDETLKIKNLLVRKSFSNVTNGYAKLANTKISESKEWDIEVKAPQLPPGDYVDIEWKSFSSEPNLKEHSSSVFIVDIGAIPVLYLNEDVEEFKHLMRAPEKSGVKAGIRDQVMDSIATNTWITMFVAAAESYTRGEEPDAEWKIDVLKMIGREIFGIEGEAAVEMMKKEIEDAGELSEMLLKVVPAIQRLQTVGVYMKKNIENIIKELV